MVRLGGLAAVAAGALFVAGNLLALTFEAGPPAQVVATTPYTIQVLVALLSAVALLGGLVGLYVRQVGTTGILGLAGLLLAFCGTALFLGALWTNFFVTPVVVRQSPEMVGGGSGFGWALSFWAFKLGWLVFALATFRAGVYPLGPPRC
jgi:hypothetical protein